MNDETCHYTLAYTIAARGVAQITLVPKGTKGELIAESDIEVVLRFPNVPKDQTVSLAFTVEGRRFAGQSAAA